MRQRREGVHRRADPGPSRRAWPALAACSRLALARAGAPTPTGRQGALQAESSGLLRPGTATGGRKPGQRWSRERGQATPTRAGPSTSFRKPDPARALAALHAPRSASCPTDLGLPRSSLPPGAPNGALASSFPFGYHPPALKHITATRMTLSPLWPEDQTAC